MGEGEKIRILNRDKEDSLPESHVGDGPLNRQLAEKVFHLSSVELEGDDPRGLLPLDGDRKEFFFGQRPLKEVDDDRTFLLDDLYQKGSFLKRGSGRPGAKKISLGIINLDRGDGILVDERLEAGGAQRFFTIDLVYPVKGFEKIFGNRFFHAVEMLGGLNRDEGLLNIPLEVLNEDGSLSFEEEMESLLSAVDFKEAVNDQNDENDSGENRKIDRREASAYSLAVAVSEQSASLPILPGVRFSWGS